MKIDIKEMTIEKDLVREKLLEYLDKIRSHTNFDENMLVRVYVNNDKDFTAFEAVNYRIQFTSYAHKIIETIKSGYYIPVITFSMFYEAVLGLKT